MGSSLKVLQLHVRKPAVAPLACEALAGSLKCLVSALRLYVTPHQRFVAVASKALQLLSKSLDNAAVVKAVGGAPLLFEALKRHTVASGLDPVGGLLSRDSQAVTTEAAAGAAEEGRAHRNSSCAHHKTRAAGWASVRACGDRDTGDSLTTARCPWVSQRLPAGAAKPEVVCQAQLSQLTTGRCRHCALLWRRILQSQAAYHGGAGGPLSGCRHSGLNNSRLERCSIGTATASSRYTS